MPPRILFVSPYSLFDSTNGAAVSMRNLLETLVGHGFHCSALTGTFSPAVGQTLGFGHSVDLMRQLAANGIRNRKFRNVQGFPVLSFGRNRVKIHIFTIESELRSHLYCQELALHTVLPDIIRETKPDLVLTSSRVQALNDIAKTAEDSTFRWQPTSPQQDQYLHLTRCKRSNMSLCHRCSWLTIIASSTVLNANRCGLSSELHQQPNRVAEPGL